MRLDPRLVAATVVPNAGAVATQRDRQPMFWPHTMGSRTLARPQAAWIPVAGFGADPGAAEKVAGAPPADVEAAARAKERIGFTLLGVGAAGALAGAGMGGLPVLVRLALAAGGIVGAVLGVKNLAEGEATRQAGAQLGLTVAKCVASTIVGGSKIPI